MRRLAWLLVVGCSSHPVTPRPIAPPPAVDAAVAAAEVDAERAPVCIARATQLVAVGAKPGLCGVSSCADMSCCVSIDVATAKLADIELGDIELPERPVPELAFRMARPGTRLSAEVERARRAPGRDPARPPVQATGDGKAVVVDQVAWSVANDAPLFGAAVTGKATAVGDVLVVDRDQHVRITTSTGKDVGRPLEGDLAVLQVSDAVFALAATPFDMSRPTFSLYDLHTGQERAEVPVAAVRAPLELVRLAGEAFAVLLQAPHGQSVVVVSVRDPDRPSVVGALEIPGCD